jgi:hypothetical protein
MQAQRPKLNASDLGYASGILAPWQDRPVAETFDPYGPAPVCHKSRCLLGYEDMTTTTGPSLESDPFFSRAKDSEWNACIGRQGDEENYVDGYMEAALELASAVIDKRQHGKRDTLAMPILYNARHAVELSLKFAIGRLSKAGMIEFPPSKDHDIKAHWENLARAQLGDSALRQHVSDLQRFVVSLHTVDADGQQLRYAETRDGERSLDDKAICNLELIRENLESLSKTLKAMKHRLIDFIDERATGTYTTECSRRDLGRIARMLPPLSRWPEPEFVITKATVMEEFGIGSRKFSKAVEVIKRHREMGSLLGKEFPLTYLTDAHAILVIEKWSQAHPPRSTNIERGMDALVSAFEEGRDYFSAKAAVIQAVLEQLSPEEIDDVEAIYYIGRERWFCESYAERLEAAREQRLSSGDLPVKVNHLMTKTNLLECMACGIEILGRRRLAAQLRAMRPDLELT